MDCGLPVNFRTPSSILLVSSIYACTNNNEFHPVSKAIPGKDAERKQDDLSIKSNTCQNIDGQGEWGFGKGVEAPHGPLVLVGQYSALNDSTNSGGIITEGLLKKGIVPLISGSRAANIRVAMKRAPEARSIIRLLISKHHLKAVVMEPSDSENVVSYPSKVPNQCSTGGEGLKEDEK